MPQIDFNKILSDSLALAKKELGGKWKIVKPYAEHEFRQLSENIVFLAQLHLNNSIDSEELKGRLQYQRLATINVLLTIQGIGLIAAQNTINGIIGIIGTAVQMALGIALPV